MTGFDIRPGFSENQRARAALLYWEAFSGKIGKVLAPEQKALELLGNILDPRFAISAVDRTGQLLGIVGFKSKEGSFSDGGFGPMFKVYGFFGGLWRALALSTLERSIGPGILLIDGIFVAADRRGEGIGGALLEAIIKEAQRRDMREIWLDVVDTNPRARALYERAGFVAKETEGTGPLAGLFGFKSGTKMTKSVV